MSENNCCNCFRQKPGNTIKIAINLQQLFVDTSLLTIHTCKRSRKNRKIFLTAGVALRAEKGEQSPRLHFAFTGCSPVGMTAAGISQYCRHHRHRCHPQGRAADFTYIRYDGDSSRGYPNLTVITFTTVTRLPCKGNFPAPFLPVGERQPTAETTLWHNLIKNDKRKTAKAL